MEDKIARLPKWAQEHIKKISRERDTAIKALNEWQDSQTKSPFYYQDILSLGEEKGPSFKYVYIQTHKMSVEFKGIRLDVYLRDGIDLQYGGPGLSLKDVALIPTSRQSLTLLPKEKMRA